MKSHIDKRMALLLGFMSNSRKSITRSALWRALLVSQFFHLGTPGFRVYRVRDSPAEFSSRTLTLEPAGQLICEPVRIWGEQKPHPTQRFPYPELRVHILEEAAVTDNRSFQAAICGGHLLLNNRQEKGPWELYKPGLADARGGIIGQRGSLVAIEEKPSGLKFERGIFLGSRSVGNWSHWLINFLPTLYLVRRLGSEFDNYPVIIPPNIRQDRHWQETLAFLLGDRQVIQLEPGKYTSFHKLAWVEPPVYDTPFSIALDERVGVALHSEAMSGFRSELYQGFNGQRKNSGLPTKWFLARKQKGKRGYNQEQAIEVASNFGVEAVYVEDLEMGEKISLFAHSDLIVGPEGSGFANILFAPKGARVLTWWPDLLKPGDNYNLNLGALGGVEYWLAPAAWTRKNPGEDTYILDIELFASALSELVRN